MIVKMMNNTIEIKRSLGIITNLEILLHYQELKLIKKALKLGWESFFLLSHTLFLSEAKQKNYPLLEKVI